MRDEWNGERLVEFYNEIRFQNKQSLKKKRWCYKLIVQSNLGRDRKIHPQGGFFIQIKIRNLQFDAALQ